MTSGGFLFFGVLLAILIGLIIEGAKKGINKRSLSKHKTLWIITFVLSILLTLPVLGFLFFWIAFKYNRYWQSYDGTLKASHFCKALI